MTSRLNRRQWLQFAHASLMVKRLTAQRNAAGRQHMPDVVVVLPGIMGSVLQKDGKDVWAVSGSAILQLLGDMSGTASTLTLHGDSPEAEDLADGITATRLIPDTQIIPGFWKVDGYTSLTSALKDSFDLREGMNYFEFAYDWRRDHRAAARRLAKRSAGWLKAWRQRSGNANAKLLILAHSMGGLVARYFIECLEGWQSTRQLITFGTPFRGSLNALDILSNGLSISGVSVQSFSAMARSFTSIYQMLPRYRCYDAGAGLVRIGETNGIPHIDSQRAAQALAFHHEIDACAKRNDRNSNYNASFSVHPIVGAYQKTLQAARLVEGRVQMLRTYPKAPGVPEVPSDGDGTVPHASAIPLERTEADAVFVSQLHASLQNTPTVLDHVIRLLATTDLSNIRTAPEIRPVRLALEIDDIYSQTENVGVRVTSSSQVANVSVTVQNTKNGAEIRRVALQQIEENTFRAELAPLPFGVYRICARSAPADASVTDIFAVSLQS